MPTRRQQVTQTDERMARDKELLAKFLTEEKHKDHGTTLKVLDELRRTRRSRGGVGEPLKIPAHLRDAAEGKPSIIITDEDLNADSEVERE